MPPTIYDFVKAEETAYNQPIPIVDNYEWSMKDHITTTILYKNGRYKTGNSDDKPNKNITLPILRLQYRSEGFDVKDITLFVNSAKLYHISFLLSKYHEKWARDNDIDTFIDDMVESYVDFGGALVKKTTAVRPEVTPLQSLAFADQSDLLSNFGIKHNYSPSQLKDMESKGWGKPENGATTSIDELITLSRNEKVNDSTTGQQTKIPGKNIEVYEVHGTLPDSYLDPEKSAETYSPQLQIVAYYNDEKGDKQGVTLFAKKEATLPFKLVLRDKIYGRALGLGGAEELFEPQVWTNYGEIRVKAFLDAAAKIVYKTTDPSFSTKNKTTGLKNEEILELAPGTDITQIDNFPRNLALFDKSISDWEDQAQRMGAATDALMGNQPTAGTPFKLQDLIVQQGQGIHDYRQGKLATFEGEIYRDWIIPALLDEINQGVEFLADLTIDEMQYISDCIVQNETANYVKEAILSGQLVDDQALQAMQQQVRAEIQRGGSRRFLKILKDELKEAEVDVFVNVAGKQKNLSGMVDKLTNVFRTIVANPYILQSPPIAKLFNKIIEASGLDPIDLSGLQIPMMPTRRMTETIDYADLPPDAQKAMLSVAGFAPPQSSQPTPPPPVTK